MNRLIRFIVQAPVLQMNTKRDTINMGWAGFVTVGWHVAISICNYKDIRLDELSGLHMLNRNIRELIWQKMRLMI